MSRWFEFFDRIERWLGRLYGAFFLALAVPLLYWGGRGLLAYRAGVRAAWSEPLACAAGLVAGVLSLWVGTRVVRSGVPSGFFMGWKKSELDIALEEAAKLERTDPVAARQVLDNQFMREAAAVEMRRAELRRRSSSDLDAAVELRRQLQGDVKINAALRKGVLKTCPEGQRAGMLAEIDAADGRLESELLKLESAIERLRLK